MHSRRTFLGTVLAAPLISAVSSDPADLTVSEAVSLIQKRKLTPEELTAACLKRIEKLNPKLNAFITVQRRGRHSPCPFAAALLRCERAASWNSDRVKGPV